ncbi:coatomer epsilon subunit-domain-containing protein [Auriculariales sp. MPI-PUGE-AT-0066]|nr:coatomer epsilon subunit-domain-containing protein [Auriculariales sp. MPI-PUGE-AT-0066]
MSELYHVRRLFTLASYSTLIAVALPEPDAEDYSQILLYQARSHIALNDPASALALLPTSSPSLAIKAVRALAQNALEELRDLAVEIEGDDCAADESEKSVVRVSAATAFARAGEIEEALETLGAGKPIEDLDAVALIIQLYLSIRRPDLARREFNRASKWAEDDLLLQHIEASIGLVTGADGYANPHSYYAEQIASAAPNSQLLTARGTTHALRGNAREAAEDFASAVKSTKNKLGEPDAVANGVTVARKQADADTQLERLRKEYPNHAMVADIDAKSKLFDDLLANYTVPELPAAA